MKNLIKLPQPLASLLVAGAIPCVPLDTHDFENHERFLVYATKQVENPELPVEWIMEASNHMVYGNIPSLGKLPVGAVVGYVQVKTEPFIDPTMWGLGFGKQMFRVVIPRIFDMPIPVPEFMMGLAHVEDFVGKFSAHHLHELNKPWNWDYFLEIPVNEALFGNVSEIGSLTLDLWGDLKRIVLDENGELRQFNELLLTCGNRHQEFPYQAEIVSVHDDNDEPVLYPSLYQECGKDVRMQLVLHCDFPIVR